VVELDLYVVDLLARQNRKRSVLTPRRLQHQHFDRGLVVAMTDQILVCESS
jgi:hypothetical protein